ncbi:MAG: Uncharacterised protein [Polaribacter sp. SA4-10]|nr:MAG: Uncharacterised protein [Polaribacter sp. SA4-10]
MKFMKTHQVSNYVNYLPAFKKFFIGVSYAPRGG